MDEYTKKIVYYMNNQKYCRVLDIYTHKVSLKSSVCGDWNDVYLNVDDEKIILDISYENSGCSLNVATLEIVCEYLIGKNLEEISKISSEVVSSELELPSDKLHCVDLTLDSLREVFNQ